MKNLLTILLMLTMTITACKKEKDHVDLTDVPESVNRLIGDDCFCMPRIGLFQWDNREIYAYWAIGPSCLVIPTYFEKNGDPIVLTPEEANERMLEMELIRMIWICGE